MLFLQVPLDNFSLVAFSHAKVRHLQFLGLMSADGESTKGIAKIQSMANKAQERYPTAVALGGILRTYSQTRSCTPYSNILVCTMYGKSSVPQSVGVLLGVCLTSVVLNADG